MTTRGAKGILITPSDTKAIVPAIKKAQAQGVEVIALDTPTEPQTATDGLFATDNQDRRLRRHPGRSGQGPDRDGDAVAEGPWQVLITGILVIVAVSVDQLARRRSS